MVHKRKKSFDRTLCENRFKQNSQLKCHVHKGKQTFECSMCDGKFSLKGSLKKRSSSVTEGTTPFECNRCYKILKHEII